MTENSLKAMVAGVILGMMVLGLAVWVAMPKMMLVVHESRYATVKETCERLKAAIEAQGWSSPAVRDMNASVQKSGVSLDRPVRIVELCKAAYAKDVIGTNPEVSTLMPCAWGVYQGDDGKVYISGMNMGLMGKMFGGNIARVIGKAVAADERAMLEKVIVRP